MKELCYFTILSWYCQIWRRVERHNGIEPVGVGIVRRTWKGEWIWKANVRGVTAGGEEATMREAMTAARDFYRSMIVTLRLQGKVTEDEFSSVALKNRESILSRGNW